MHGAIWSHHARIAILTKQVLIIFVHRVIDAYKFGKLPCFNQFGRAVTMNARKNTVFAIMKFGTQSTQTMETLGLVLGVSSERTDRHE